MALKSSNFDVQETEKGRLEETRKREIELAITSWSKEEGEKYVEKLSRIVQCGSRNVDGR